MLKNFNYSVLNLRSKTQNKKSNDNNISLLTLTNSIIKLKIPRDIRNQ